MSRVFTINLIGRCPAKKMPGRVGARTRQKEISHASIITAVIAPQQF
jgi:hypothetical protein